MANTLPLLLDAVEDLKSAIETLHDATSTRSRVKDACLRMVRVISQCTPPCNREVVETYMAKLRADISALSAPGNGVVDRHMVFNHAKMYVKYIRYIFKAEDLVPAAIRALEGAMVRQNK